MKSRNTLITTVIFIIGVVVLLNVLANRFFVRLDLTEDDRYTLSDATKDILKSLTEPVTITAYFSENLPPDYASLRRDFKDMLTEYESISKGMVVYEFVNPLENDETEQEVVQKGILQAQIQGREKDEVKIQKAYMGAEIQLGETSEVIPIIQSTSGMEYNLTSNIKKLSVAEKPLVGILQGHGEPSPQQLQQVLYSLDVLYQVQPVTLTDSTKELDKFSALAIVAPTDSFPVSHLQQMNEFLSQGKGIFVAMNRVGANLNQTQYSEPVNTGLETWLAEKGIAVNSNFVIDQNANFVGVQMQQGPFMVTQQLQFPYFPIMVNFADHPITSGLEQIPFQFVSSINFTGDSSVVYTSLIKSSEKAGTEPVPGYINIMKEWGENDFPLSDLTVAAAVEGKLVGNTNTRMVVVADGDFPLGRQQQNSPFTPDNISLMINGIDWLSDDTGLVELRTKGATSRPIDDLEDGKRTFLKYLNFLLPIILIIVFGIFRAQSRQNLRIKRMEEGYV